MKILITSGATREPIDSVRYITNMSTGRTGVALAEYFEKRGSDVWLLRGLGSAMPAVDSAEKITAATFVDFTELNQLLKKVLREEKFDAVVHLAAVSDYSVDSVKVGDETHFGPILGKLGSEKNQIEIKLKKNFKIIEKLKSYSESPLKVIAFKLTSGADEGESLQAVRKLYASHQVDLVVHNDLEEMTVDRHPFRIISAEGEVTECGSLEDMAENLFEELKESL